MIVRATSRPGSSRPAATSSSIGVVVGRHAVAPHDLQLPGHHRAHVDRGAGLPGEEEPDLDVAAAGPQAGEGVGEGGSPPEGVEGEVDPAAGQLADLPGHLPGAGIDRRLRPERPGEAERGARDVDGHDPHAPARRDHHCGEACAAAAEDGAPVPGLGPPLVDDRPVGGGETAAEPGSGDGVDPVGKPDEVGVGDLDHDPLGEGAPTGEPRLDLVGADVLGTLPAQLAAAAGVHEGCADPVARPEPGNRPADLGDDTRQLVAGDVREPDVGVVAHPGVPVAAAQPARGTSTRAPSFGQVGSGTSASRGSWPKRS